MHYARFAAIVLIWMVPALAFAQPEAASAPATTQSSDETDRLPSVLRKLVGDSSKEKEKEEEKPVVTEHELTIDGQVLKYKATAGQIPLKDDNGKTRAKVFFVYYERFEAAHSEHAHRPIAFVFNGARVRLRFGCIWARPARRKFTCRRTARRRRRLTGWKIIRTRG